MKNRAGNRIRKRNRWNGERTLGPVCEDSDVKRVAEECVGNRNLVAVC